MGNFWSSQSANYLDGLGFSSQVERSCSVAESREKLEQLLRASINSYRPGSVAVPLTAAFYLGADPKTLTYLFEKWNSTLCIVWPEDDPVADSIGKDNLDEFDGDARYESRYYEYFRDCLTEVPSWNEMVKMHMDQLSEKLANDNLAPLIELAAALEADNGMIAAAALTMACTRTPKSIKVTKAGGDTKKIEGQDLSMRFRHLAKRALELRDLSCTLIVHACAEVFLSPNTRLLTLEQEVPILNGIEQFLTDAHAGDMPDLTAEEALKKEDADIITYTRSRLVLKKLAI